MSELLDRAGGVDGLRRVLASFYDAVFADPMIGFYFRGQDKARLIAREVELMAAHFGAQDVPYQGRPLAQAHARHRIFGGHFDRRTVLLKQALETHGVPADVRAAWLAHTQAQRALVVAGDCT